MSAKYECGLVRRAATDAAQEAKRTNLRNATAGIDGHGIGMGGEKRVECREFRSIDATDAARLIEDRFHVQPDEI